jgi:hypothetical protein
MTTKKLFSEKNLLKTKTTTTTSRLSESTWKKHKTTIENDTSKEFNTIEIFDKNNKLIDGNIINPRDLVSVKCYIRYWKHFTSKWHGLTLKLATVKLLNQVNLIKDNYDTHRLII